MDHHTFTDGEWHRAKFLDHPTWPVQLSFRRKDYAEFSRPCPKINNNIKITSKLDSCAQTCLWSKEEFLSAGFKEEDLIPVSLGLNAANKSSIKIDGAILARINAVVDGKEHSCATMVYISPSCQGFFMSMEAMLDLDLFRTFNKLHPSANCSMLGESSKTLKSVPKIQDNPMSFRKQCRHEGSCCPSDEEQDPSSTTSHPPLI